MCQPARRQTTDSQRERYRELRSEGVSLNEARQLAAVSVPSDASFLDSGATGEREPRD